MASRTAKQSAHPALKSISDQAFIVAHRGASKFEQENTMAAFERAIELGSHMIELDVRQTRDRVLVVHHDPLVGNKSIDSLTYEQLVAQHPDANIATFSEVIKQIAGRALVNIEIKEEGLAAAVMKIVSPLLTPDRFVVSSFLNSALIDVKEIDPRVCTGLILGQPVRSQSIAAHVGDLSPWKRIAATGANFVAVHYLLADVSILRGARKRGIPVMVWTLNAERRRRRFAKSRGVVAVIVDDPTELT